MQVLGIETSCDETGVAVYDSERGLLAHSLYSQIDLHQQFGGIVPELASRDHVRKLLPLVEATLQQAKLAKQQLHAVSYTKGPGLIGALLVGASFARSLSFALQIPSIGIHHMEAHLTAALLESERPSFPFLALLISGGHTLLVEVKQIGNYQILGESLDDAVGETFDKTAKLLGLPYPGGPHLAKLAHQGNPNRYSFPRPMLDRPGLDFSFSGLKTSVLYAYQQSNKTDQDRADIAASFQEAVVDTLLKKCERALKITGYSQLVIAGGVGANQQLRYKLQQLMHQYKGQAYFPRPEFCTDNGAMIAFCGHERLQLGFKDEGFAIEVKPRWRLAPC